MGVPALFRWLSTKYPLITSPVIEDEPKEIAGVTIPVNILEPNPNGEEFDNLYLDMNGIVHPCSHPEDKPPPQTEEEMMLEVFKYTDRVVNMVRPRKLLMIAVDGVAPRAKMNQQRSRRFRSAQEARDKDAENVEFLEKLKKNPGKAVLDESVEANIVKKTWDTNSITPGTPFMDILALSLRYWVAYKLNTDPGWANLKIIISDATVPGEGEHKIMEFVRSQRRSPGHDPNTRHVIYGLDADLIMLGLATHEAHFRVLREDVFAQDSKQRTCRICGQTGHFADQCQGKAKEKSGEFDEKKNGSKKPFIWLDVRVLREYLEVELEFSGLDFKFDLERALDDWVFMCFFVGNDFLPHLPSLEIREKGIDTLISLWKQSLPAMGGYVTENGQVHLGRAQHILSGLAGMEKEIFKRRKIAEDKREAGAKRRQEQQEQRKRQRESMAGGLGPREPAEEDFGNSTVYVPTTKKSRKLAKVEEKTEDVITYNPANYADRAAAMEQANLRYEFRKEIYQASLENKSAAQVLKEALLKKKEVKSSSDETSYSPTALSIGETASLSSATSSAPLASATTSTVVTSSVTIVEETKEESNLGEGKEVVDIDETKPKEGKEGDVGKESAGDQEEVTEDRQECALDNDEDKPTSQVENEEVQVQNESGAENDAEVEQSTKGDDKVNRPVESQADTPATQVNDSENSTSEDQIDTVRLWEDGYEERYYEQKFKVAPDDLEFRHKVAASYVEGLCWVLLYYYQGCPSWNWYFPYHYAPFAADFVDMDKMEIKFELGTPFRPFEQLMGVLPAASAHAIPEPFRELMTDEDSGIVDFYPETFPLDLNGKKFAWQGVALLPFIDEKRLLAAMATKYPLLTEEEHARNEPGQPILMFSFRHPLYAECTRTVYGKKAGEESELDPTISGCLSGTISKAEGFLPDSELVYPLETSGRMPDLPVNNSMTVNYLIPRQEGLHKSEILPGVQFPPPVVDKRMAKLQLSRVGGQSYGGAPLFAGHSSGDGQRDWRDQGYHHYQTQPVRTERGGFPNYSEDRYQNRSYQPSNDGFPGRTRSHVGDAHGSHRTDYRFNDPPRREYRQPGHHHPSSYGTYEARGGDRDRYSYQTHAPHPASYYSGSSAPSHPSRGRDRGGHRDSYRSNYHEGQSYSPHTAGYSYGPGSAQSSYSSRPPPSMPFDPNNAFAARPAPPSDSRSGPSHHTWRPDSGAGPASGRSQYAGYVPYGYSASTRGRDQERDQGRGAGRGRSVYGRR